MNHVPEADILISPCFPDVRHVMFHSIFDFSRLRLVPPEPFLGLCCANNPTGLLEALSIQIMDVSKGVMG